MRLRITRFLLSFLTLTLCLTFIPGDAQTLIEEDGFINVDGASIYFKRIGNGEPIIVIHGGPGLDHTYLASHLIGLSKNYQLIFFDQRACGKSTLGNNKAEVKIDTLIRDIDEIRAFFKLKKVHIMAHGYGGLLALKYSLKYPDHVKSLVLVDSYCASSDLNEKAADVIAKRLTSEDKAAKKKIMGSKEYWNHNPKSFEDLLFLSAKHNFYKEKNAEKLIIKLPPNFYENGKAMKGLNDELSKYDFKNDLKNIKVETLLIYGDFDPLTHGAGKQLKENIKKADMYMLSECGHFPFIEAPEKFVSKITGFYIK